MEPVRKTNQRIFLRRRSAAAERQTGLQEEEEDAQELEPLLRAGTSRDELRYRRAAVEHLEDIAADAAELELLGADLRALGGARAHGVHGLAPLPQEVVAQRECARAQHL